MIKFQIVLTILALLFSGSAKSDFDLFNPDRGKPPPPPPAPKPPPPPPPKPFTASKAKTKPKLPNNTLPALPFIQSRKKSPPRRLLPPIKLPPQKNFELRGTSIIGSYRAAILKGPDGKEFLQALGDLEETPAGNSGVKIKNSAKIAGYDYYLLDVEQRKIKIEYPQESPCRDSNTEKGLQCEEEQIAVLKLISLKALPTRKPAKPKVTKPPKQKTTARARTKRQTERDKRKQLYRNFKRRVIKNDEVPPGMRVVRTPFGDRLVPDNKK
jgi:hypothetical protein